MSTDRLLYIVTILGLSVSCDPMAELDVELRISMAVQGIILVVKASGFCWDEIVFTRDNFLSRKKCSENIIDIEKIETKLWTEFNSTKTERRVFIFAAKEAKKGSTIVQATVDGFNSAVKYDDDRIDVELPGDGVITQTEKIKEINVEGLYFAHYLREVEISQIYRRLTIKYLKDQCRKYIQYNEYCPSVLQICLHDSIPHVIDYAWGYRIQNSILQRQHLDTLMSWLSTLGGACSALGDYNRIFAERAGAISQRQLQIAASLGDPLLVARCRLYTAISLIQQRKYKTSAQVIRHIFAWAQNLPDDLKDQRLINMCHGIWTKLQHEFTATRSSVPNGTVLQLSSRAV
ncbi:uncharacterized protein LOC143024890 isoform X4 [Oratosquilla oratoria]|uniref:uncharacterized protein LOC143024890 isoform X4 n=1 Tax=Oratosquilla oratoria TaxID=337810 RepID=UPI003F75EC9B